MRRTGSGDVGANSAETPIALYWNGDRELADRYETILTGGRGWTLVPMNHPVVRLAAQIRAATSACAPDALPLATALIAKCTTFVTNARRLPVLRGIRVVRLDDIV